ncbi:MAG: helix-turn-helix transcriptional regulator [Planctomycetes bacterium]|nr:helix-turn-helix transcriptional regulator [Planctomycetota bacterium]
MASDTIENEISAYRIGEKVRQLRQSRNLKLTELGAHTSLSAALLSKIESGKLIPTLPTLTRIALVFSVGLEYFFEDHSKRYAFALSRKAERKALPATADARPVPYTFEALEYAAREPRLHAFLAHFREIEGPTRFSHQHGGIEFIYVISGRLELTWRGDVHTLEAGDAVYFDATPDHGYRRLGAEPCDAVVVTLDK